MFDKIIIYGLGISGIQAAQYFIKKGQKIILTDDNSDSLANSKAKIGIELVENNQDLVKFVKSDDILSEIDEKYAIIFAPGIPLYFPERHKILEYVEAKNLFLTCDIEMFYLLNSNKNDNNEFISITGTNGKSTSSALTDFILRKIGLSSKLAGNIGIPVFELMKEKKLENENFVVEISSFHLDLMSKSHFQIAAISNVKIDHIDRHGNFENYYKAKKHIFNNQEKGDYSILNYDDENCRKIYDELQNNGFESNIILFSINEILDNGISIIDGVLYNKINNLDDKFELNNLILKGNHNLENIALSFSCVISLLKRRNIEITQEIQLKIIESIKKFRGLKHRMEFLGQIDNVKFVNDSKATNSESSEKALRSYDNIFWILGGKPKKGGINSLKPHFNRVKKAYLIGEASEEFSEFLAENNVDYVKSGELEIAIKNAFEEARNGENNVVMLSPACSSFDQWKNFEERGEYFRKIFEELRKK